MSSSSENTTVQLTATRYTNKYGSCVRLDPTNFSRWLSGIEPMLMAGDLYNIATGAEPELPETPQGMLDDDT